MNPSTQPAAPQVRPAGGTGLTTPSRRGGSGRMLADVVVDLGFMTRERMDAAIDAAQAAGTAVERVLVSDRLIDDDQLARAVAERFGLDHLDLELYRVDPDAAKLVTPAAVRRYQAVPVCYSGDRTLLVAMADPANVLAVDDIAVMTGYEVRPAVASAADIERLLERLNDPTFVAGPDPTTCPTPSRCPSRWPRPPARCTTSTTRGRSPSAPAARTRRSSSSCTASSVRRSSAAPRTSTSSPSEHDMRVRYRIDGVLQEAATIPASIIPAVTSRVKILSDLDIAERRVPQDGRISMEIAERHIDLRVATLPSAFGENVVMRILDQSSVMIELEQLGMLPQALERFTKAFGQSARRGARHRPDRLGQVDVALRRAQPAQHDREEHHHDRGPGRVPARRRSPRCRSTTRPG